jgi:hypothetical protein
MEDIRTAIKNWYVIHGDEHLKMGSFSDAVALMEARARNSKGSQLIMMSDKEYGNWFKRKTKKGKNS